MTLDEIKNSVGVDFSRVKILGYYDGLINSEEVLKKEEAAGLYELLLKSFVSIPEGDKIYDVILNNEIILKNISGNLLSFSFKERRVKINSVIYEHARLINLDNRYKLYFNIGENIEINECADVLEFNRQEYIKVRADVLNVEEINGKWYYKVYYGGKTYNIKLLEFEVNSLEYIKKRNTLDCIYKYDNITGDTYLMQERSSYIANLYEEETAYPFTYLSTEVDKNNKEYHNVSDSYGFKHKCYGIIPEEQRIENAELKLYVKSIRHNGELNLALYNPNFVEKPREWYDANRVFAEINRTEDKSQYFDEFLTEDLDTTNKYVKDFVFQYNKQSNLWVFSYLNMLNKYFVDLCIKTNKIEELTFVANIIKELQVWMVEKSKFLDLFNTDTKTNIIAKSSYEIINCNSILEAIDIVKKGEQYNFINEIINAIKNSGRLAYQRNERLGKLLNILRISPEFIVQDTRFTSELFQLLVKIEGGLDKDYVDYIIDIIDNLIDKNIQSIRSSKLRTNDIDITRTANIYEILSLLGFKILIYNSLDYKFVPICRETKAKFFRFLSFVSSEQSQGPVLKAGIDSLVGILDDKEIFTWENIETINVIKLCNITANSAVLESNVNNNYSYCANKGGYVVLGPTGFTIVPDKQSVFTTKCIGNINLSNVNVLHTIDTLPLKIGTMYNYKCVEQKGKAIDQFLLWNNINRRPIGLDNISNVKPQVGDCVKILVKNQKQPDKLKGLIFVKVIDSNYDPVEGVIPVKEITDRWVEDARTIFNQGEILYAKVSSIIDGKYNFSIKEEVDKLQTESVINDARRLVQECSVTELVEVHKDFIQELVLLVDMYIKKEVNLQNKLTLSGYAYSLCSLLNDSKSYYYDFKLKYYASIENFIEGQQSQFEIEFNDNVVDMFPGLSSKYNLIRLLSYVNNTDGESKAFDLLVKLASKQSNDVGKIASMLLTYIYAQKANLTTYSLNAIKKEINDFISNPEDLDLSSLALINASEENNELEELSSKIKIFEDPLEEIEAEIDSTTIVEDEKRIEIKSLSEEIPTQFKPLRISINEDSSISIVEDKRDNHIDGSVLDIPIKEYAKDGNVLLVNNKAEVSKLSISSLSLGRKIDSFINPYVISNHFVLPTDCIFGLIITTNNGKYLELRKVNDIMSSTLDNMQFIASECKEIIRYQSFIIPEDNDIDGIQELYNKLIEHTSISSEMLESLRMYGVFI